MSALDAAVSAGYAESRRIARAEAKNFYYAFITLPAHRRQAVYAGYAFCRLCDDIADGETPLEEKLRRLQGVERELEETRLGRPGDPLFHALAHAAATFRIPWQGFQEVVQGVRMDLTIARYATFDELRTYCYRVASVVGLICLEVFGYRDPRARDYAVHLGLAMQLTNILRDLGEDAGRGRIYLPQEDLERFGYTEEELLRGAVNDRFVALMRFQVARAREHFREGKKLLSLIPVRTRPCPAVLGGIYTRLLDRIEGRGYDVFRERVSLTTGEKLALTLRLTCQSMMPVERLATAW